MASYYESHGWQAPTARQASWEQPAPPSRSGSSSVSAQREDTPAFSSQFDEIDRAVDNLLKSGKLWNNPRRDSMPMAMGRQYPDYDPRMMTMAQRHHSMSDFDGPRMHPAANLQGFYASQRYQGRPNDVEQAMQAKRRMAAQRERELRNYHQEQQYNRSLLAEMSGTKSDRSVSPAAMSEDSRRELLARQHRALYGNESPAFFTPGSLGDDHARTDGFPGPSNGTSSATSGVRGASPRGGVAPVSVSASISASASVAGTLQSPNRANSTSSPNPGAYGADQPTTTSTSSPVAGPGAGTGTGTGAGTGGSDSPSSARQPASSTSSMQPAVGSVGPIGSRPIAQTASGQAANPALSNKRSTTPLPSPLALGYGFSSSSSNTNEPIPITEQRSTSSASNPVVAGSAANGNGSGSGAVKDTSSVGVGGVVGGVGVGLGGWGNGSGVWGSKNGLGVQASVWG